MIWSIVDAVQGITVRYTNPIGLECLFNDTRPTADVW